MRKLFLLFWALLATICLWAHDFEVDGIYYNYLDGNNVEVTYKGSSYYPSAYSGEVTIPETVTYDGIIYSVTSIGECAVSYCSSLTSITIPNSVTSIGDGAFRDCSSLTSITIPEGVTSIGGGAFYSCSSLTSITIPEGVTSIGDWAFRDCSSLTSVTIPNSVTSIGESAFNSCSRVTMQGTTPPSITANTFNNNATFFVPCSAMDAYLAALVWQFLDLHGLNYNVNLTATEGGSAQITATDCESSSVTIEATPSNCSRFKQWSDGNTDNPRTLTLTCDITLTAEFDVTTYSVSITAGEGGYLEYGNIEREYNECNREWIYNCAYANEGYYFAGWSDGSTNQCIDIYPYEDINLVAQFAPKTQIIVLVGVDNASKNMGSVSGSGIYYSGDYVTISATPNAGYHFVEWSDGNGNATRELYLQSDTTLFATFAPGEYGGKCGDNLYWTYSDNTITITGSGDMKLYEYSAWHNEQYQDWYTSVSAVQFPEGITSIDYYAFSEMSLTSVVVPASVTYFGENAFAYNYNLTRFEYQGTAAVCELNDNGRGMLYQSDNLVYFKGQKDMLSYMDSYAYLDTVIITSGEGFYEFYWSDIRYIDNFNADDWIVEGEDYSHMHMNPVHTIILPESLQEIGDFALTNARHLEQITIPAGVTRIGESAFEECRSLESVTFAGTALREIDDWAFYNCHSLKDITIPEGVTSIGKAAFFDCTYLSELTLPASMEYIADNGFALCAKLRRMNVNATTPPQVEARTFEDVDRTIPVVVPDESVSVYKSAPVWQEFNIVAKSGVPAALDNIPAENSATRKLLRDGQLIILRDGVEYNVMGQQL